jgi:alkanesulfonate monooxygenase SsuD/methylene tetrahydromethanopterin reductase-like flavin-dependent oxidoreductase (luciferase family)
MRFGIKTSQQDTTWDDLLAVWKAADDIEVFESAWNFKDRMDRIEEGVQVVIGLLENETTDFDGRFFRLTGARNEPQGPQRPHPPICIGGSGEKRTLRITAKYADHWNDVIPLVDDLKHKLDVLDGHCQAVGRDRSEILISGQVQMGADEAPGAFADRLAELGEAGMQPAIAYIPSPHKPDVLEPLAEALRQLA